MATHRAKLAETGLNLWWTWNPDVIELFRELDAALWRDSHHNPIALLARFDEQRLTARIQSERVALPYSGRRADAWMRHPSGAAAWREIPRPVLEIPQTNDFAELEPPFSAENADGLGGSVRHDPWSGIADNAPVRLSSIVGSAGSHRAAPG